MSNDRGLRYWLGAWIPVALGVAVLGDHPKAATYDHLKSGHFEGLRHTH
jgi:hypothetical protein